VDSLGKRVDSAHRLVTILKCNQRVIPCNGCFHPSLLTLIKSGWGACMLAIILIPLALALAFSGLFEAEVSRIAEENGRDEW